MTKTIIHLTPTGDVEQGRPAADRLISGNPEFTTWNIEDADGLYCGIWQSTSGKWRISYDEWEYFHILSGTSVITQDGAAPVTLAAGDSYILRPGFTGTWEVLETTTKDYVIRL
ncbi:MAG: cupin domain-containing protein [Sulfitobacter sp.]